MRTIAMVGSVLGVIACGGSPGGTTTAGTADTSSAAVRGADLVGAGSTFAYPLYAKWAADYAAQTGVHVAYQSVGSGAGVRKFSAASVDFGGTDGPMSDQEIARAKGGPVLHVPTALGADVLVYNLVNVLVPLKLTPDVIADIFLGKITKWNDARLKALNPDAKLSSQDILVVHRTDGSGTTYVWTDYLSRVSASWAMGPGRGRDIKWPVGEGGNGNDGVADKVKSTPGAVGYVELAYAKEHDLPRALVENADGNFVAATIESITAAAAEEAEHMAPDADLRLSIIDAAGRDAYPIASLTWILIYKNQPDSVKGKKLLDFLRWGLTEGQTVEPSLDYAPLPPSIVLAARARLDSIRVGSRAPTVAKS